MTTVDVQVIHGTGGVWPTGYTTLTPGSALADPSAALVATGGSTGGTFAAGDYTVSYTFVGANGETLPSAATTVTISGVQKIQITAPTLPVRAYLYRFYVSDAPGGTRRLAASGSAAGTVNIAAAPATSAAVEPTANTTAPPPLRYGRADDESGNVPVPIPQAAPTSAYSWPKTFMLAIAPQGAGVSGTISNLSVALSATPTPGLRLFARQTPGAIAPISSGSISAPTASPSLPAGTYRFYHTYVTDTGETTPLLNGSTGLPQAGTTVLNGSQQLVFGAVTLPTGTAQQVRAVRWYICDAVESTTLRLYLENQGQSFTLTGFGTGKAAPVINGYATADGTEGTQMGQMPPTDLNPRAATDPNTPSGYTPIPVVPVGATTPAALTYDARSFPATAAGTLGYAVLIVAGVADKSSLSVGVGVAALPDLIFSYDEQ